MNITHEKESKISGKLVLVPHQVNYNVSQRPNHGVIDHNAYFIIRTIPKL